MPVIVKQLSSADRSVHSVHLFHTSLVSVAHIDFAYQALSHFRKMQNGKESKGQEQSSPILRPRIKAVIRKQSLQGTSSYPDQSNTSNNNNNKTSNQKNDNSSDENEIIEASQQITPVRLLKRKNYSKAQRDGEPPLLPLLFPNVDGYNTSNQKNDDQSTNSNNKTSNQKNDNSSDENEIIESSQQVTPVRMLKRKNYSKAQKDGEPPLLFPNVDGYKAANKDEDSHEEEEESQSLLAIAKQQQREELIYFGFNSRNVVKK